MTPIHAPAPPTTRRTARDILRGLLAVIALAAFVIGVPVALLVVAPSAMPHGLPTWDSVIGAMTRPDDGTLLFGAVQLIAWVAWAAFTTSVIAELTAAARRVNTPHIPLLGGTQRLAATLVTTAGLLLATSNPLVSTAAVREAVAVSAPLEHVTAPPATGSSAPDPMPTAPPAVAHHAPEATSGPTVTVERGDTLWGLAERHLGDGHRYAEIVSLNVGHPQSDGRALDDAHWIYPGWQLRLPADASAVEPDAAAPARAETDGGYVVERGDTLWDIAAEQLGDAARYPEIVDLNHGVRQPDGAALTDPDLIRPGWILALPVPQAAAPVAPPLAVPTTPSPEVPASTPEALIPTTGTRAAPWIDDGQPWADEDRRSSFRAVRPSDYPSVD